jgi:hypothetical protein
MDSYNHELDIHHQKALRKTLGKWRSWRHGYFW